MFQVVAVFQTPIFHKVV